MLTQETVIGLYSIMINERCNYEQFQHGQIDFCFRRNICRFNFISVKPKKDRFKYNIRSFASKAMESHLRREIGCFNIRQPPTLTSPV